MLRRRARRRPPTTRKQQSGTANTSISSPARRTAPIRISCSPKSSSKARITVAATEEYERTAYEYPQHEQSAEAAYAAVLSYREHEATLSGDAKAAWHQRYLDNGLRFGDTFPEHPESAAVLTTIAEDLFQQNQFDLAIAVSQTVTGKVPPVTPALARTSWTVIAHSQFDLGNFVEAEKAYYSLRPLTPPDDHGCEPGNKGSNCVVHL